MPDDFTHQRKTPMAVNELKNYLLTFTAKGNLIDFTLSNANRFYSSKGDPLAVKGLKNHLLTLSLPKAT